MDEDVHGANLCQLVVVSEEPEGLSATFGLCHLLHADDWAIVPREEKKKNVAMKKYADSAILRRV